MELSRTKRRVLTVAVCLLLLLALLWTACFFIRPICLQRQAEAMLGRKDVVSLSSWQAPWLYINTAGELCIKRERVRGDTLVIPDVMDGVPVTLIGETGGESHGIKAISLPPSITVITFWSDQFADADTLILRDGCALEAGMNLFQFSEGITLCLPRNVRRLEKEAFRKCHESLVIRYAGTEAEWLALSPDARLIAEDHTVIYESEAE